MSTLSAVAIRRAAAHRRVGHDRPSAHTRSVRAGATSVIRPEAGAGHAAAARHRSASRSARMLTVGCVAGLWVLAGCTTATGASGMELTVSTTTDRPVTIYFDTHEEGAPGLAVRSGGPTPLELSPRHRSTVVSLPYDHGDWLRVRVAAPPDRPAGITVGCELRATNGRLVARDATSPTDPPTTVASCAGAD